MAGLSHVFNYDLPNEPEAYIHRIGRTGRAGLGGDAISFCCIDEMKDLYAIEKLIGRKIPREESAWPMQVFTETVKEPRPQRPERVARVNMRGEAVAEKKPVDNRRRNGETENRPAVGNYGRPATGVGGRQPIAVADRRPAGQQTYGKRPATVANTTEQRGQSFGNRSAAASHGNRQGEGNRAIHREQRPEHRAESRFALRGRGTAAPAAVKPTAEQGQKI